MDSETHSVPRGIFSLRPLCLLVLVSRGSHNEFAQTGGLCINPLTSVTRTPSQDLDVLFCGHIIQPTTFLIMRDEAKRSLAFLRSPERGSAALLCETGIGGRRFSEELVRTAGMEKLG